MANRVVEKDKSEEFESDGRTKGLPLEPNYTDENGPTMELRQEAGQESQEENSKSSPDVECSIFGVLASLSVVCTLQIQLLHIGGVLFTGTEKTWAFNAAFSALVRVGSDELVRGPAQTVFFSNGIPRGCVFVKAYVCGKAGEDRGCVIALASVWHWLDDLSSRVKLLSLAPRLLPSLSLAFGGFGQTTVNYASYAAG
ncbi:hypothetical protein L6452_34184 [Arctium lappa]|uniref:Uncharacterized protein n=1 Tax=Arctium lappa TaxID=4217 RepID=A0ACB8YJ34_ARCLA|nr:hypothetical protein L6452_34184 [Arctium lappa]